MTAIKKFILAIGAACLASFPANLINAQSFPTQPIRINRTGRPPGDPALASAPSAPHRGEFGNASPFRPRIARTMPHLRQCDAMATGRYMPIHL
jgi:hypothetical protein